MIHHVHHLSGLVALGCAGCQLVFPLADERPAADAQPVDVATDGASCSSVIDEDFNAAGEPPCGTGEEVGQGISRSGGQLVIQPPAGVGITGACETVSTTFTSASVQVLVVPEVAGMFVELAISDGAHTISMIAIHDEVGFTFLHYMLDGMDQANPAVFVPASHRYWRLRDVGGMVVSEVSENGVDYQSFLVANRPVPAPTTAQAILRAGAIATIDVATPAAARFDDLRGCP